MNKFEHEKVLDFAIATSLLVDKIEEVLEEYECEGELTDNQLIKIKRRIRILKEREKGILVCNWHEDTEDYYGNFKEANGTLDNLMQYTELNDKNGKEIYEGDIIQFVGEGYKANGVVKYGIRRPKMINENNELGFYVGWSSELCWRRDLIFWSRKCEVIGNIYINPELMWRIENV